MENQTDTVIFRGRNLGQWCDWLMVDNTGGDWKHFGFAPSTTKVTSNFKPVFWRTPTGQWVITFSNQPYQ